jgi:pyruvate dehydrogenase phosphatase
LYEVALSEYKKGNGKVAFVGTCALVIIVHDNKLYIANLGDAKAELYRKDLSSKYSAIKLNNYHNAKSKHEQARLKKEFPNDSDIVVSHTMGNSYYVKGKLQPTRTLGDFYMKHKVFNQPTMSMSEKYIKRFFKNFNGPYIKSTPEITIHELEKGDDFLILATDGLWDFLSTKDSTEIVNKFREKGSIARELLSFSIKQAASSQSITTEEIYTLKPGSDKRTMHDDITVMVVDLRNQNNDEVINH